MERAGPVIGMPFSLEGFAFFLEAIFLGLYLYGWQRLGPRSHLFAGVMVSLSGVLSGAFVVTANAWMNTPAGFRLVQGEYVDVDPLAAMFNPAAGAQVVHMLLAAYAAVVSTITGSVQLFKKMTRTLALVGMLVTPAFAADETLEESGNAFIRQCSVVEQERDLTTKDKAYQMVCAAYVSGYSEGAGFAVDHARSNGDSKAGQLVKVVLKHIREHPETAHSRTYVLVGRALQEAFPCRD